MNIPDTHLEQLYKKLSAVKLEAGDHLGALVSLTGICSEIASYSHRYSHSFIIPVLKDEYNVLRKAYNTFQESKDSYANMDATHMVQASIKRITSRIRENTISFPLPIKHINITTTFSF